jgi:superfamily I DNA and/or RNA helicase
MRSARSRVGKQVIVVGDPKQLPPTTFFDRSGDGYDDASDLEDLESILDECLGANIPHKRLVSLALPQPARSKRCFFATPVMAQ